MSKPALTKKTKKAYEIDTAVFDETVVRTLIRSFKLIVLLNREIYKARSKDGKKLMDKDVYVEIGDPDSGNKIRLSRDQVKNLNSAHKYKLAELSKYHEYAKKTKRGRKGFVNVQKVKPEFITFIKNLINNIDGADLDTSDKNLPYFNRGFIVMTTFISVISAYIRDLREKGETTEFSKSFPVDDVISGFLTKTVPKKVRQKSKKSKGKIRLNFKNRIAQKLYTEINKAFNNIVDEKHPEDMHRTKAYIIDLLYETGININEEDGSNFTPGMLLLNEDERGAIIEYMELNEVGFPSLKELMDTDISDGGDSTESLKALEDLFDGKKAVTEDLLNGARKITAAALLNVSLYSPFLQTEYENVDSPNNKRNLAEVLYDGSLRNLGYNSVNDFESGFPNSLKMVIQSLMSVSKSKDEKKEITENRQQIIAEYQSIKEAVSINMPDEEKKRADISEGSKKRASDIKAAFNAAEFIDAKDRKYYETRYKTAALRAFDQEIEAYVLRF